MEGDAASIAKMLYKTEDGDTLLHTAIRQGVEEFVQTLALKAGEYSEILTNERPVSD